MRKVSPSFLSPFLLACLVAWSLPTHAAIADAAESELVIRQTGESQALAPHPASPQRRYAPDRVVHIRHFELDITPNFTNRTIDGQARIQFTPSLNPVTQLKLDAVDLTIQSVTSSEPIQAWQAQDDQVVITFAKPLTPEKVATLTVHYSGQPTKGIYFRTPEMGYKPGDTHLFSQGEAEDSRYWFPLIDAPNEKFSSEVTCRVPEGMTVISNGRLVSTEKDAATGLLVFHWSQEKPHSSYLITLVAGYFQKLEDRYHEVPLTFWTPPSEITQATNSFRDTREIMDFFETEIGVPYPWAKYDQICVNDFVEGGMENTSATTLTDSTLFLDATENIHSSELLVAHEMAHQWFGDLVTCKDWSDIWLNEGFATYYEALFHGHKHGRDALIYELYGNARGILAQGDDTNAIVRNNYGDAMSVFGYLAYPKGGWVLHMLRSQLGEDLYRRCIQTYLNRHAYRNVQTEDLRAVIHELSGRSFESFFDQWLYHAHHPELEVSYRWDEATKLAKVSIQQVQTLSPQVLLFDFPLTVRFQGPFGTNDEVVQVKDHDNDFYFPLASAPKSVRIDPDYTLLAKIHFDVSREMLQAYLANTNDLMGRLIAVDKLSTEHDHESVKLLQQTLQNDPFYGVRIEAAQALDTIHSDEALDALIASTNQPDARVRQKVIGQLGSFYRESAYNAIRQSLAQEKNPEVVATAIQGLAPYAMDGVRQTLLHQLTTESYRDRLCGAAIEAMRSQDDPVYLAALLEHLGQRATNLQTHVLSRGIDAVAYLARNEEKKDIVREFVLRFVNDPRESVKLASLTALGTLGDPKALPVLKTFARAAKESRERKRAEEAISTLRSTRKPVDDFKNLREEVLTLQKEGRDLRKELDDLKKKVHAQPEPETKKPEAESKKPEAEVKKTP